MLTALQIEAREGLLTGSRVGALMNGDEAEIVNLWRELVGDPAYEPEDLSGVWAVQLGSHTESLNLDWYEKKTGKQVVRRGEVVVHPELKWAACTLDGWVEEYCIEAKHVGGREPLSVIVDRYQPQLQWMMFVTGARKVALSVIMGAAEPIVEYIDRDDHYIDVMVRRATEFMECVWSLRPPFALPPPVASPPLAVKRYDLTGNNEWAANAVTWLTTRQARKDCESAEKTLKKMVPEDAAICFGHGIQINRDRAGRLAIREQT